MKPKNVSDASNDAFINQASKLLDQSEQQLDSNVLRQLRIARHAALEKPPQYNNWAITGGLASTAAMLVLTVSLWNTPMSQQDVSPLLEDIELLSAADDLEFYEELEFYLWLDEKQHTS